MTIKEKIKLSYEKLKPTFGYKNVMQSPKIVKVVVSSGIGKMQDKKKKELVGDRLAKITGQKPSSRKAKKSIAGFKLREGDEVGYQVTLRGSKMDNFLEKLTNIALPRTKDFRGLRATAIDEMGNFNIGIKEHTIFPETADEEIKDVFGLAITIVTTSKNPKETRAFLELLGFPFEKKDARK